MGYLSDKASWETKKTLQGLINTPFMPDGTYSQDCRDGKHHGRCTQCDCWCHKQAMIDRLQQTVREYERNVDDLKAELAEAYSHVQALEQRLSSSLTACD